jgi:pyridoxamine 5'-phosphate oxidase family protein
LELIYSEPEIEYLKSQRLARIATVTRQGKPDVSPVAFEFDGAHFFVGSHSQEIFLSTRKYKHVRDGNKEVALQYFDFHLEPDLEAKGSPNIIYCIPILKLTAY